MRCLERAKGVYSNGKLVVITPSLPPLPVLQGKVKEGRSEAPDPPSRGAVRT